ncbi:MAG: SIMPL domain-containing protein [Micromonosporaceae bacterium]
MTEATDGVLVTGTGRVVLDPDVLLVQVGAEAAGAGVSEALNRCSAALAAMTAQLRRDGVGDPDLQTTGASVHQAYHHDGQPRGWSASQQLTVRLRDLSGAGELLTAVLDAGGDAARLHAVRYDIDRSGDRYAQARTEARARAYADALAAAQQYAALADRRLGVVISVREGDGGYSPPSPLPQPRFAAAEAMPVESGELDVMTTVEVRWQLLS